MGKALADGGLRHQAFLMTKCCTHGRGKEAAFRQLHESLRRLRTDHLDLWQIHEVVYENDPERHFAKGGAVEALAEAKRQGKVRFVGFTGHKDPHIHLKMLQPGLPVRHLPASRSTASTPRSAASSAGCSPSCSCAGSRPSA